jgi:hypothetical protein
VEQTNKTTLKEMYASSLTTVEDFLRSDICGGRAIYCAFDRPNDVNTLFYLRKIMREHNIVGFRFQNQEELRLENITKLIC